VVVLLLIGAASAWFEFTPMASVVDARRAGLGAGIAALLLSYWRLRRRERETSRPAWKLAALAGAAVTLVAAVLLLGLYREEDVRFPSGDAQLAGTLFLPRAAGVHPAVVFLHGAGREERQAFEYQAKLFARHGIVAFAYDKRGSGQSGGSTYDADYRGYAADAAAAIRYLRSRNDIRDACIGIMGHSEGGWIASLVAGELVRDLSFVIVTSTTPLTPAEQVLFETGARTRAAGFSEETVRRALDLQRRVLDYQRSGVADPRLRRDLAAASKEPWFAVAELPDQLYTLEEYAWWRRVMDFDSTRYWRQVHIPVLAISGGRDLNSDVRASQTQLRQALTSGGNRDFTGVIYPNMEHGGIEWWLPGRLPPPRFPRGYSDLLIRWSQSKFASCNGANAAPRNPKAARAGHKGRAITEHGSESHRNHARGQLRGRDRRALPHEFHG
jgi:alpha-beta hydrolase superfamily lysophospholipase